MHTLIDIFLVSLSCTGIISIWFYSPLKCTLAELIFKLKNCWDISKFDSLVSMKYPKLGFLSGCHYCVHFWASCFFSVLIGNNFAELPILIASSNGIHHFLNKDIYAL